MLIISYSTDNQLKNQANAIKSFIHLNLSLLKNNRKTTIWTKKKL